MTNKIRFLSNLQKFGILTVQDRLMKIRTFKKKKSSITNLNITYSKFLKFLDMGWVKRVDFYNHNHYAIIEASRPEFGTQLIRVAFPKGAPPLIQKLKAHDVNFASHRLRRKRISKNLLIFLNLLPLIYIGSLIFLIYNSNNFPSFDEPSEMDIAKSPAKFQQRSNTGVTFDDVAGIGRAKAEVQEIISFLKEPEKYKRLGARIPSGSLLIGPPGTGKTLIAKAMATEAEIPFFNAAGSDFVEMFIGLGAARIRDLFDKAYANAPCIIFIDEIDAVGSERGSGMGGGSDEREQTLNQLLVEMDGFDENKGVMVVGATNRVEVLDAALTRPGRFDRKINITLPNRQGRLEILNVHAKNKLFEQDVLLKGIAAKTIGLSGAELASILNEAALSASKSEKNVITKKDVDEAVDRNILGIKGPPIKPGKGKYLIAYREIGHAFIGSLSNYHEEVEKVTLIPRGRTKGLTWFKQDEDKNLITQMELITRIMVILAGHLTEQIVFGILDTTNGNYIDLREATQIARQMVKKLGMSNLGPMDFDVVPVPPVVSRRIDAEVLQIINQSEAVVRQVILNNRVMIDILVEDLLNTDTLEGDRLRYILDNY